MPTPTDYSATIQDYFKHECPSTAMRHDGHYNARIDTGRTSIVPWRVYADFETNAKFVSFFIPACKETADFCVFFASRPELALSVEKNVEVMFSTLANPAWRSSDTLVFTNKMVLYVDAYLTAEDRRKVFDAGQQKGVIVEVKDRRYADEKAASKKRDAFISFDWRNRDSIAKPLALALCQMLCPVWYAEFVLQPGDNLRESIEKGLKECKKCIVILSREYLCNSRWAKTEFDSVFTRERIEQSKVIVPIWYRVTEQEVFQYCPSLAGVMAEKWINKKRAKEVAAKIKGVINAS